MGMHLKLKTWAQRIKRDGVTLWFACKHPATPWYVKGMAGFVVAYALSPVDLIPDFIPILGYLDDVVLLPCLIWLTIQLLPESVLLASRAQADEWMLKHTRKPRSLWGGIAIVAVWIAALAALALWLYSRLQETF
ncbi:DUF1232 domain-containing protein [Acidovorax sp. DW039]|uniref:YkvA family protein n=1 Tax=Acidovorax sp. DW039 TaxID=3095606 RepID=UPI0030927AEE|nr:DUF1232 domain-containing protein [Acidovorax sp. DW039]